eukprot:scaffold70267_cov21-Tisochrysis_lutea.AAC.1
MRRGWGRREKCVGGDGCRVGYDGGRWLRRGGEVQGGGVALEGRYEIDKGRLSIDGRGETCLRTARAVLLRPVPQM